MSSECLVSGNVKAETKLVENLVEEIYVWGRRID